LTLFTLASSVKLQTKATIQF